MRTSWFDTTDRFRDPVGAVRLALFLDILDRFPPGKLVDLGAGHGMFSLLAADRGWQVTAVDARDERFQTDPRITWVKQDVRECDIAGHDLVLCLGLWYHLALSDQVDLAKRFEAVPLVLDTHVAMPDLDDHGTQKHRMGEMTRIGDHEGRLYFEGDIQHVATASFGNDYSFWPTEDSLRALLTTSGYDIVETFHPAVGKDRRFFVARALNIGADALDAAISPFNRPRTAT